MITKKIIITDAMTGKEALVRISQGTTTENILKELGLPEYNLAKVKNRQILRQNCDVSRVVEERERLYVFAPIEVGRLL